MITNKQFVQFRIALSRWEPQAVSQILGGELDLALDSSLVKKTFDRVVSVHKGRKRDDGLDYLGHCLQVRHNVLGIIACRQLFGAWHRESLQHLASAEWLALAIASSEGHDNFEDAKNSIAERQAFEQIDPTLRLSQIIEIVSRRPMENYYDFIHRVADPNKHLTPHEPLIPEIPCLIARIIKAADLQDNLKDQGSGSRGDKYRFALDVVDPFKEMRRCE